MAQTLGARASSLGASALLLGSAILLALNATYHVIPLDLIDAAPPPVVIERLHEEPPKPPPPRPDNPPPSGPVTIDEFPTQITSIETGPTETLLPIGGGAGPVEITSPRWTRVPSNLERFYPQRSIQRGVEGRAVLDCAVSVTGSLSCTIVSETPAGYGFGDAALRISREYSMAPATADGLPVPGRYRMDVPFQLH